MRVPGWLERLYDLRLPAVGLSAFRIAFAAVLLAETLQLFHYRHLIFDRVPYLEPAAIDPTAALIVWMAALVLLLLGLWTRVAALVNYGAAVFVLNLPLSGFDYHHDFQVIGISFLLVLAPSARTLSLDRWLERRAASPDADPTRPPSVRAVYVYLLILVGLGLVYFDSVLYKLASPIWMAGRGLWQPATLPFSGLANWGWILDQRLLVLFLGSLTVAFELLFLFLVWFRWARLPLCLIGVGLHAGILVFFAIPLFALGSLTLYILVFFLVDPPAAGPEGAAERDPGPLAAGKARRVWALSGLLALIVSSQALCLAESPPLRDALGFVRELPGYTRYRRLAARFLGIHPHAVFEDVRIGGVPHPLLALAHVDARGRERWLPIITPEGFAHPTWTGRNQVFWVHRVCRPPIDASHWPVRLERVTAYWRHQLDAGGADARFIVYAKVIPTISKFEPGLHASLVALPWIRLGTARWSGERFSIELPGLPTLLDAEASE